ncbi:MAG: cobalamin synthesis protein CobW [Bacteroidetes bacterium]|nr:cobalamin synthesis protein CobW [Bacteroidota bacterium]
MHNERLPVTIITGFLGAGKTTLLNNIIAKYPQKKFAIIENEFGEIGIDGGLIVGSNENIFELNNGCICCSLQEDFSTTIEALIESPFEFNHLLVETTGIANPDTIINSFLMTEKIVKNFILDSTICVVDAQHMEDLIADQPEVLKQLAVADTVLINKADSVHADYLQRLQTKILSFNYSAAIHSVSYANISEISILDVFAFSGEAVKKSTLAFHHLGGMGLSDKKEPLIRKKRDLNHEIMNEGFQMDGSFDFQKFNFWIKAYMFINRSSILRIKGIISFHDVEEKVVFQAVKSNYLFEIGEPWGDEPRFCKMVFIGKKINSKELDENLHELMVDKLKEA